MRPSVRLLLGLPLAALITLGCGSSTPPAAATPAPGSAPAAATATTAAPTATRPPATPTAAPAPDFASILRAAPSMYKVTYNVKTTTSGQPSTTNTATMYVKPPQTRFDTTTKIEGRDLAASIFIKTDGQYICSEMTGEKSCLRLSGLMGQMQNDPSLNLQQGLREKPDDYIVEGKGTRQIAGMTAVCFTAKLKSNPNAEPNETCYSNDAIPLGIYTRSANTQTEMEATAVSRTVADADFQLTGPVMEMPAMPGTSGMPGAPGQMPNIPGMPPGQMPNIPGAPAPSR